MAGTLQLTSTPATPSATASEKQAASSPVTLYQYDSAGHLFEETDGQGNVQADDLYLGGRPVPENMAPVSCTSSTTTASPRRR